MVISLSCGRQDFKPVSGTWNILYAKCHTAALLYEAYENNEHKLISTVLKQIHLLLNEISDLETYANSIKESITNMVCRINTVTKTMESVSDECKQNAVDQWI